LVVSGEEIEEGRKVEEVRVKGEIDENREVFRIGKGVYE